jgi:thiol-disulfide isomerase/thioredoxin
MKSVILLIFIMPIFFNLTEAQQTKNHFVLNGNLSGQNTGSMYLYYSDAGNKRIKDSAVITDGKFSFTGNITEPTMAYLQLKEEKRNQDNSTDFFIEPSVMTTSLQLNKFKDAKLSGSKTQNEYAALQTKRQKIDKRWKIVMDTLTEVNKRSNVEFQELKDWVLQPYSAEIKDLEFNFFTSHPQSYVTAYMLRFYVSDLSLDSLQMFYNNLGKKLQQSGNGKDLAKEIKKIKAGSPGSTAADFTAMDINGNKLSLSDFKGKYVLLDFWASWCVPCRKGNPHLKDLYAKYKDKGIEFIGISDDDSKPDAWHKAVEKDDLQWRHVLRGFDMQKLMKNELNEKDISEKFGIHSLPTKILIDPQGKIIGRYSEEAMPLDDKLKNIFGS